MKFFLLVKEGKCNRLFQYMERDKKKHFLSVSCSLPGGQHPHIVKQKLGREGVKYKVNIFLSTLQ